MMFFTTLPETETTDEITDRRKIIITYLSGWFIIDLSSILPFDTVLSTYNMGKLTMCNSEACLPPQQCGSKANVLLRVPKITKALRGLRLLRLVKVFKLLKSQKKLSARLNKSLKISSGF